MRLVFIGQNQQQVENLILIAKEIQREKSNFEYLFVSLDNVHYQNTLKLIKNENFNFCSLPFKLNKPFYLTGKLERFISVWKAKSFFKQDVIRENDVVILGCDGAFERSLSSCLKKRELQTYLIVDGVLHNNKNSITEIFKFSENKLLDIKKVIRSFLKTKLSKVSRLINLDYLTFSNVGHSPVNKIFVIGESTKNILINEGIPKEKIIVTGLPRNLKPSERNYEISRHDLKVLYLPSAYKWHGLLKEDTVQQRCINNLITMCDRKRLSLTIKMHPREKIEDYNCLNVNLSNGLLIDEIYKNDIIISSFSTALLDGVISGKVAISYVEGFSKLTILYSFCRDANILIADSISELESLIEKLKDHNYYKLQQKRQLEGLQKVYRNNTNPEKEISEHILINLYGGVNS